MSQRCAALALAITLSLTAEGASRADEFDLPPSVGAEEPGAETKSAAAASDPIQAEAPLASAAESGPAEEFDLPPSIGNAPAADKVAGDVDADVPPDSVLDLASANEAPNAQAKETPAGASARQSNFDVELRTLGLEAQDGETTFAARASAHWYGKGTLTDEISTIFNLRARATLVEASTFEFDQNVRLDVQELALSWTPTPALTLLGGRVNIRNGVALGFNPTDWFKASSLVISDSQDPGDRREERLGVVILGGSTTVMNTLFQFGYRPQIDAKPGSWLTDEDVIGLGLDRTNPSDAFYLKATPDFGGNLALTGNLFVEDGRPGAGVEMSAAVSDSLVLYGEAFVQQRQSLASEALAERFGGEPFRDSIGANYDEDWLTQIAIGGTWSLPTELVGARDVSVSLEYHFNQAGLTGRQIDALAGAAGPDRALAGLVHGYAADQQEPLARDQLFARVAWNDFWGDADLALIGYYAPADSSGLYQLSADIPVNDNVEFNVRGYSTFGGDTSIYGANPIKRGVQIAVKYAF